MNMICDMRYTDFNLQLWRDVTTQSQGGQRFSKSQKSLYIDNF